MTVGWVTLDVGEQALIYDHHGSARIEDGPKRLFLFRERMSMLQRHSANQNEYLVLKHRDGRIEHMAGPCVMFHNTIAYQYIKKKDMISLDANEALVVYQQDEQGTVKRFIKYGPTLFMPKANEWLHSFSWHGTDPNNKTRLIPNSKHFERLQIIPDQFYYNVDEVRTADDALIRVKLMLFYELKDIELMLDSTKDPIADFINCVCADTVAFAAKFSYIEFIEHSAELNNLSSFPQLTERAKSIGYSVSKVVFRGYFAHDKLQKLHDSSIEVRTKLKIADNGIVFRGYFAHDKLQKLYDSSIEVKTKLKIADNGIVFRGYFAHDKLQKLHDSSIEVRTKLKIAVILPVINYKMHDSSIEVQTKLKIADNGVIFRGYFAHDKLQKLHDSSFEVWTKLKIAYETEEQEQRMTDMKMTNEKERIDTEQKIELAELKHQQELEKERVAHQLDMEIKRADDERQKWSTENMSKLEATIADDQQKLDYYKNLHGLGVDLNQFIQSQSQRPEKITRIVADGKNSALHFHHS